MKKHDSLKNHADLIFKAAIDEVDPYYSVKKKLKKDGNFLNISGLSYNLTSYDRIVIAGAGKASARMAKAVEDIIGDCLDHGVVVVKYDHTEKLEKTLIVEAAHPVPDKNGEEGALKLLELAEKSDERTLILFLVSGGGSALTPLPAKGTDLSEKQKITEKLLKSGASIHEINTVRKNLSRIKGGKFAEKAYPATVVSLILSDVVGDNLDIIASGMTVEDKSKPEDCFEILDKYKLDRSGKIKAIISGNINPPDKKAFDKTRNILVGCNYDALKAAKRKAEELGYNTLILSSTIEGDTKSAAKIHCEIAKQIRKTGDPVKAPACILSGGETTLVVKGDGKGGRNQEFALECVGNIKGEKGIIIYSAGTDGTDGPTDAAGAYAEGTSIEKAEALNIDYKEYLNRNDSYNYFDIIDGLIKTGPTKTNVMDIKIVLVSVS